MGALVVLNEARQPIGIVTDRDLMIAMIAENRDPYTTAVGQVMTKPVRVVSENESIEAALALMQSGAFRRLPVVDAQGQLVGLVSLDDVLMLLGEELASISQLLQRQTPLPPPKGRNWTARFRERYGAGRRYSRAKPAANAVRSNVQKRRPFPRS